MRRYLALTATAILLTATSAMAQGSGSAGDIGGTAVSPNGSAAQSRQPATMGIGTNSTGTTSGSAPRSRDASEQRMKSDTDTRRGSKPDGTQ
jgi:hypothetical protein